jgi:hypothetical protein
VIYEQDRQAYASGQKRFDIVFFSLRLCAFFVSLRFNLFILIYSIKLKKTQRNKKAQRRKDKKMSNLFCTDAYGKARIRIDFCQKDLCRISRTSTSTSDFINGKTSMQGKNKIKINRDKNGCAFMKGICLTR